MKKKGETATECLIILAVVIILALIVVGVLEGLPMQEDSYNEQWECVEEDFEIHFKKTQTPYPHIDGWVEDVCLKYVKVKVLR